jgi:endogenous inhibitor of DNA gyrase (YacG/DUF329 family)
MTEADMTDDDRRSPGTGVPSGEIATKAKCPQCGRPVVLAYRPFCSKRCADIDLSRWLNGVYAVPGRSTDEEDDEQDQR